MDNKLQELEVLIKTAPFIKERIKAKYQRLNDEYQETAEKLTKETYGELDYIEESIQRKCDLQFGSEKERIQWEKEEMALLHDTIYAKAYELFPELVYKTRIDG